MNNRFAVLMTPVLLSVALSGSLALANGGGGDDDAPIRPNCPKGQVFDSKSKRCVRQTSSLVPDEDRTNYAYRLAKDGRYEEALALLDTLKQPNTAKALNYRCLLYTSPSPRDS